MKLTSELNDRTGTWTYTLTIGEYNDLARAEFTEFDHAVLRTPHDESRKISDRLMDLQIVAQAVERGSIK